MLKYVKPHELWYELCTNAKDKEYEDIREWIKATFSEKERYFDYRCNKHWLVKSNQKSRGILENAGWVFDPGLVDPIGLPEQILPIRTPFLAPIDPDLLPEGIRTYQAIGARMIIGSNGNIILGDDMGLGKSLQTLTAIKLSNTYPTLIICPAIAKDVWEDEIAKWTHVPFYTCEGRTPRAIPRRAKIVIINYDILAYWWTTLAEVGFQQVAADECHRLKNEDTKWVRAFIQLSATIPRFIAISGTPILSYPAEFWVILHKIAPDVFKDKAYFLNRYCKPHYDAYGQLKYDGCTNAQELHALISPYLIRRKKSDVARDLPEKNRIKINLVLENYEQYLEEERKLLAEATGLTVRERLLSLNRTAYYGKRTYIIEWLHAWLDDNPGQKIVVVTYHQAVLDDLLEEFSDVAVTLDGRSSKKGRRKAQDDFKHNDNVRMFIGEMMAMNVAVTLTSAATMAIVEFISVPGVVCQTEDRIHRLTQEHTCNIYIFVGKGTVEERAFASLARRSRYTSAVLDGVEQSYDDDADIETELIKDIRERSENGNTTA